MAEVTSLNEVPAGLKLYKDLFDDKNAVAVFNLLFSPSKELCIVANKCANSLVLPFTELDDVASQTATPEELQMFKLAATAHIKYNNREHPVVPKVFPIDGKSAFMREDRTSQDADTIRGKLLESIQTHKERVRSHLNDKAGDK